ncbi:MAG: universal stress protein [Bacteroidota bacterium]|jgi:nucleotide-binding universal stress UspA family protein|nr:universal stress protein [Ignavibacteria bacterium]MCU7500760.1 universal stress protein [Ignavibacteria bacterium]MCU7513081.1 universal stress protein [Ignavibacteria bacterium]MCU7522748.1 universal stress protein [Ignavibacteria bacterium]MCU7526735.1 universal stress protein [Ignavibacteria bacterium]
MNFPFRKIALAVTFSPNALALLNETKKLQDLFKAELVLIHVGDKSRDKEETFKNLISSSKLNSGSYKVSWVNGEPSEAILKVCSQEKVDLLVAGALEKENLLKYYVGSVARKILRNAAFSVLIMTAPSKEPKQMTKFCISVDYTPESEVAIKKAYEYAMLENAREMVLLREFQVPGLAMTVQDSGSTSEIEDKMNQWQKEEEDKLALFTKEMDIKGIKVKPVFLYGRQGWEANRYIHEIGGDILVVPGPRKKLNMFDRIFQHDMEFILKQLPGKFLVVKP